MPLRRFAGLLVMVGLLGVCDVRAAANAKDAAQPNPEAALAEARKSLDSWSGQHERLDHAKTIIDQVLQQDPKNYRALKELARYTIMDGFINTQYGRSRPHIYRIGNFQPGTLENAEAIVLRAIQINPQYAEGYVLLGHIYTQQDKVQEAAAALRKAEEIGTDDPWLHLNWASLHSNRGEYAAATERWQRVLREGTTNEKALLTAYGFLIGHYKETGQSDKALSLYEQQVEKFPSNAWLRGEYSIYLRLLGRNDEAISQARTALRVMDHGAGRSILALALFGKWAELVANGATDTKSEPFFQEAIEIWPNLNDLMAGQGALGSQALVRALIAKKNVSINAKDEGGSTALLIAVNRNRPQVVKFLLGEGADPNVSDQYGWTPLISAADEGNEENVKALLAAGADARAVKRGGIGAAMAAEMKGFPKLARLIREYAAPAK